MNVVIDTNVVISAIFWPGDSRRCLALWARRRFHLAVSIPILDEYAEIAQRLSGKIPQVNPKPWLRWIERKAKVYETSPLGNQISRDPDDDPFFSLCVGEFGEAYRFEGRQLACTAEAHGGFQFSHPHGSLRGSIDRPGVRQSQNKKADIAVRHEN